MKQQWWIALINEKYGTPPGSDYHTFLDARKDVVMRQLRAIQRLTNLQRSRTSDDAVRRKRTHDEDDGEPQAKRRTSEKTHLEVCDDPLQLVNRYNTTRQPSDRKHRSAGQSCYIGAIAGPFSNRFVAVRLRDKWACKSRGPGPRIMWGHTLCKAHSQTSREQVRFYVDTTVAFSAAVG